jgi:membrane-associated protease RseP (regulator of RpoE activity)
VTVGAMVPQRTAPDATTTGRQSALRLGLVVAVLGAVAFWRWSLAVFIVFLLVSIFLHELGHFLGARWGGMRATEFFIGFGPRIWSRRKGDTEFGLKPILLGAYVKVPGMHNLEEVDPAEESRTYRAQSYGRRARMVFAGPGMNLAVALLSFCVYFAVFTDVRTTPDAWPRIGAPSAASAAAAAGLQEGDRILAIDGITVATFDEFRSEVVGRPGEAIELTIDRNGTELVVAAELGSRPGEPAADGTPGPDVGFLGVSPESSVDRNVLEGVQQGFTEFGVQVKDTVIGIAHIFSPSGLADLFQKVTGQEEDDPFTRPTSIVGITDIGSQAVRTGVAQTLFLLGALNLALGMFNLLPLLPLDGGHLLIATYERIRSRPGRQYRVDFARIVPFFGVTMVLLMFVMLSALYLDVT